MQMQVFGMTQMLVFGMMQMQVFGMIQMHVFEMTQMQVFLKMQMFEIIIMQMLPYMIACKFICIVFIVFFVSERGNKVAYKSVYIKFIEHRSLLAI